ncbi:MAG: hypothetical protein OEN55_10345 [Alphaproteobacteria bacterium]|nr:hypothetical protein [Alphaproteobacteria bacterium]
MRRKGLIGIGIAVLIVLAGISLLVAEGLLFDSKPDYSAKWAECSGDDVCVAVSIPCGWTAVNRRYREAAEAYYNYLATVIDIRCSSDDVPSEAPPAYCRAGRCAVD